MIFLNPSKVKQFGLFCLNHIKKREFLINSKILKDSFFWIYKVFKYSLALIAAIVPSFVAVVNCRTCFSLTSPAA